MVNMELSEILNKKVSFQETAWAPISNEITVIDVLNEIKTGKYLNQINTLREILQNGDQELYSIRKTQLPCITFCASFINKRTKDSLKTYNYIVVLDIDKLTEKEIIKVKNILTDDKFVFSFWESPSKKGIKGLVSLKYDVELSNETINDYHKYAFQQLREYFSRTHQIELDESGSDTTRLCFVSYDADLMIKSNTIQFQIEEMKEVPRNSQEIIRKTQHINGFGRRNILYNPKGRNDPRNRKCIQSIIKFLEKRNLSITNSYEECPLCLY